MNGMFKGLLIIRKLMIKYGIRLNGWVIKKLPRNQKKTSRTQTKKLKKYYKRVG